MFEHAPRQPRWLRLADLGVVDEDDAPTQIRKRLLATTALVTIVAVTPWTIFYYAIGIPQAAVIPTFYIVASAALLLSMAHTHDERLMRVGQLTMFLILPPLVQVALGGFANSSAVVIYAAVCPLAAISFAESSRPGLWAAAFVGIVVIFVPLDSTLAEHAPYVPPIVVSAFFAANIITTTLIAGIALYVYVNARNRLASELEVERGRSDRLLLNVMPASIADRLKGGERPIADRYERVGVLFADIVDFTSLAERMTADELVEGLNSVFSRFDDLVQSYGLEKIKTIGDAYMVISGAPDPGTDINALANLAIDMRDLAMTSSLGRREQLAMRFGMDLGPVIAGVIGESRFIYDVYGDAVNTASRMESNGVANRVQVTGRVIEALDDSFQVTERGTVDIKGKGPTRTWFLERLPTKAAAIH
jgi:adenylate cyclase